MGIKSDPRQLKQQPNPGQCEPSCQEQPQTSGLPRTNDKLTIGKRPGFGPPWRAEEKDLGGLKSHRRSLAVKYRTLRFGKSLTGTKNAKNTGKP